MEPLELKEPFPASSSTASLERCTPCATSDTPTTRSGTPLHVRAACLGLLLTAAAAAAATWATLQAPRGGSLPATRPPPQKLPPSTRGRSRLMTAAAR